VKRRKNSAWWRGSGLCKRARGPRREVCAAPCSVSGRCPALTRELHPSTSIVRLPHRAAL